MTKEVMISIRGIQFDNGQDGEKIESIQKGEYYYKNNTHYISSGEHKYACLVGDIPHAGRGFTL